MDSRRLILFMVFSLSLFMLWDGWLKSKQAPPAPPAAVAATPAGAATPTPTAHLSGPTPSAQTDDEAAGAPSLKITTDMMELVVSARGGSIVHLELPHHRASHDRSRNFVLFEEDGVHRYVAQTGLIGQGLPNHKTLYQLPADALRLADGQDRLEVRLVAPEADGVAVTKVLTFTRGSYVIDVRYEIANRRPQGLSADAYFQFTRDSKPAQGVDLFGVNFFTGPAFFTDAEKFQKVTFEEIEKDKAKFAKRASDGWVSMVQHYFVGAWLPPTEVEREFFARKVGPDLYAAGVFLPVGQIAPGGEAALAVRLYAGPQEQDKLAAVAPGLDLVVDYGWLTVIAAPLFWLLDWIHKVVGNWGWAIILLTVGIKAAFFPLSAASYKSMAKLRTLGPRMQRMKELYGHDKAKMQQEMMTLYRTEKINPLGGCLPILVQIPVFIALYWVLLASVEMRHAPWLGWIQDLSGKDPYFILPIIMGVSMLVQMKLNPPPPDPIQAKIMMALPVVFTFMFLWFPSGLVLYWVVNNTLSIAQQWQINRMIEGGGKSGKPA